MSKITSIIIQEKNKKRCNIYIDGDFFIGVPIELVYEYSLKVGKEIEQSFLQEITLKKDKADALEKSVKYISKSMKTKKQVKTYLVSKGYSEEVVKHCIDKLTEYGYINDKEYAKKYIETTSHGQGKNLIAYKLMMKGVSKDLINNEYDNLEIDSKNNAKAIAEKRLKNKEITKELLAKTYRYLISKGFSYEDASFALESFKEN